MTAATHLGPWCLLPFAIAAGCYHQGPPQLSEPVRPSSYVAKVKNVLVGLPPTDDEIAAVTVDPSHLRDLIDGWMTLPQYQEKLGTFFALAFQQTQISTADMADQVLPRQVDPNAFTSPQLMENVRESFARTALALVADGRPFNETMTTTELMMTPALMELYAFLDAWQVDDAGKVSDAFRLAHPDATITVTSQGSIPVEQSVDAQSPSFMHWVDPDVATAPANQPADCVTDPIVFPASAGTLHYLLLGALDNHKNAAGTACPLRPGTVNGAQLQPSDFTTWKRVRIRTPKLGETPTDFYDIPKLRGSDELLLSIPRVGFFSTPAFFANWPTNTSNQMRATVNQALIVATGAAFDGTDPTIPHGKAGIDVKHDADPACMACHQTLDPTRSILASTYSWNYHRQTETRFAMTHGAFAFRGVETPVATIDDFAQALANHPLFATGWAQKLCYWVNSAPCPTDDPEFQRVVAAFRDSHFNFCTLVRELYSSTLVTHARPSAVQSAASGEVIAVTRRDHLCAALNARLGLVDVCNLHPTLGATKRSAVATIVSGFPSDGYGRGAPAPVLPNQPTLFYRAGIENLCASIATSLVDGTSPPPQAKHWSHQDSGAAIADFVHLLMGLAPSDPRAAPAQAVLTEHFENAKASGASPTNALRSAFVVSCLSPSLMGVGL